jgi:hypothetical protein
MRVLFFTFCILLVNLAYADSYEIYSENGKMGIKNERGQVLVPASFESLGWSDGSFSVIGNITGYRKGEYWGLLNLKSEFITKADFESLVYGGADNIIARKKINPVQSKTGCLNLRGEIKIPFQYDGITINGLRAIVFRLSNARYQYGLIDLTNQEIIPLKYRSINPLGTLRYAVENENKKIALFSEEGKAITDFVIDSVSSFTYSKAIIYENLKQGIINRDGEIVLKPIYREIKIESDNKVSVQDFHNWLFLDEKNNTVSSIQADEINSLSDDLFLIKQSGKLGLMDNQLQNMIPVQYNRLERITPGKYIARAGNKTGVINEDNTPAIPFKYDSLAVDHNTLRAFQHIEGWSLINSNNHSLTYKYYDWIGPRQENLFPVINNHYWGAINDQGEEVIHCVFDSLIQITQDLIVVKFRGLYGVINSQQTWMVAPQKLPIKIINNYTYAQHEFNNTMLKNISGEVFYFSDNKLDFQKEFFVEYLPDGTQKTIDYEGHILDRVPPPQVSNVEHIFQESEGYRGIKRDGKFGFVDGMGRLRIANRYDDIGEFHEGLAAFKLIGKWGFINTTDQVIINPNYNKASFFRDGLAIVYRNGKAGVIDKRGTPVLKFQYDSVTYLEDKKFMLYANSKSGLANEKGIILIDPRFEHLQLLDNSLVIANSSGKYGVITQDGLSVIPLVYDFLTFNKNRNQFCALKKSDWKTFDLK